MPDKAPARQESGGPARRTDAARGRAFAFRAASEPVESPAPTRRSGTPREVRHPRRVGRPSGGRASTQGRPSVWGPGVHARSGVRARVGHPRRVGVHARVRHPRPGRKICGEVERPCWDWRAARGSPLTGGWASACGCRLPTVGHPSSVAAACRASACGCRLPTSGTRLRFAAARRAFAPFVVHPWPGLLPVCRSTAAGPPPPFAAVRRGRGSQAGPARPEGATCRCG